MSEHLRPTHEHAPNKHPDIESEAEPSHNVEKSPSSQAEKVEHKNERVNEARHQAEHHAHSAREIRLTEAEDDNAAPTFSEHQLLKNQAFGRSLAHIQRRLSGPNKALSKVIHNPGIDAISETASKSVARPSGFLGGGLTVLIGSLVLLYTSKHYGFEYNYSAYLILLVIGFVAGLIIEFGWRLLSRRKP